MDAQRAEPTVEELLARAAQAGLPLRAEEADQLRAGVRRIRAMAAEVRTLVARDVEPSSSQVSPSPAMRRRAPR
jgi:hypothetical protein